MSRPRPQIEEISLISILQNVESFLHESVASNEDPEKQRALDQIGQCAVMKETHATPPLEEKIKILSNLINYCTIGSQNPRNNLPRLQEIKDQIIQFIVNDREILDAESQEQYVLGLNPIGKDLIDQTNRSLLAHIISFVLSDYNIDIANSLIEACDDLSQRHDLIWMGIDQKTFASFDLSPVFDGLIARNIPIPADDHLEALLSDSRLESGHNASKLATSFFVLKDDDSLIGKIYQKSPTKEGKAFEEVFSKKAEKHLFRSEEEFGRFYNFANRLGSIEIRKGLFRNHGTSSYIKKLITNQEKFVEFVHFAIECNNDHLLRDIVEDKNLSHYIEEMPSHNQTLKLAVSHKFTKSFQILINAGFHPSRREPGEESFLIPACRAQGRKPLESYFDAIEERYNRDFVGGLLRETDAKGMTLLTHAISGKAYIRTIALLLERGANLQDNFDLNLKCARSSKHDGVLDFMEARAATSNQLNAVKKAKEDLEKQDLKHFEQVGFPVITEICMTRGTMALNRYFVCMSGKPGGKTTLGRWVNEKDSTYKCTPLYHAINGNSYNTLIGLLLEKGANPNKINSEKKDALSLALEHQEYDTAQFLLESKKMEEEIILKVAKKFLVEEHHNALLTRAFVSGLNRNQIASLPLESRKFLLEKSQECELYDCVEKILGDDIESMTEEERKISQEARKFLSKKISDKPIIQPRPVFGIRATGYQSYCNPGEKVGCSIS